MSSGQLKKHHGFNKTQIKDGKIVRMNKNGTIKAVLGKYPPDKKWAPKIISLNNYFMEQEKS